MTEKYSNIQEEELALGLGEMVGANVPFDVKKYWKLIEPFIETKTVYRYWSDESIPEGLVSTTTDINVFEEMIEDDGITSEGPITKHTGRGFDPYKVLRAFQGHVGKEQKFIDDVIKRFGFQKEFLLIDKISPTRENTVASVVRDGNQLKVEYD